MGSVNVLVLAGNRDYSIYLSVERARVRRTCVGRHSTLAPAPCHSWKRRRSGLPPIQIVTIINRWIILFLLIDTMC
jgi:hypothetical protein